MHTLFGSYTCWPCPGALQKEVDVSLLSLQRTTSCRALPACGEEGPVANVRGSPACPAPNPTTLLTLLADH